MMVICNINNKLCENHWKEIYSTAQYTHIIAMHLRPLLKTKNTHRRQKATKEGRNKHIQLRNKTWESQMHFLASYYHKLTTYSQILLFHRGQSEQE